MSNLIEFGCNFRECIYDIEGFHYKCHKTGYLCFEQYQECYEGGCHLIGRKEKETKLQKIEYHNPDDDSLFMIKLENKFDGITYSIGPFLGRKKAEKYAKGYFHAEDYKIAREL